MRGVQSFVHLDTSTHYIDECFPLEIFWEIAETLPLTCKGFRAIFILPLLDLRSRVIPANNQPSIYSYSEGTDAFRKAQLYLSQ